MCDILVIDDDAQMRAMLSSSLEDKGYEVARAAGLADLFEQLDELTRRGDAPAILVCDYRRPGGDGLQVIERIKNEYPEIEVILITAFGDEHVHRRASELGAVAVFDKPFALDELHREIEELLRQSGTG